MELKTLKDLVHKAENIYRGKNNLTDYNINGRDLSSHLLKQEAIKWFLYGVKKRKNPFNMFLDFHNITEEDLSQRDDLGEPK